MPFSLNRITRRIRSRWLYVTLGGSVMALTSQKARADMNLIEAFLDGNDLDCVQLRLEAICLFFVIKINLLGITFSLEATPQLSHFTPDFLVSTTGRQGTSPSKEINQVYERLAFYINEPLVEAISGEPVPDNYSDTRYSSGKAGDAGDAKTGYNYSEVQIVGSPGNIFTLHQEGFSALSDIPGNIMGGVTDVIQTAATVPSHVITTAVNTAVGAGGTDSLAELEQSNPTLYAQWVDSQFGPTQIAEAILGPDVINAVGIAAEGYSLLEAADYDLAAGFETIVNNAENDINDQLTQIDNVLNQVGDGLSGSDATGLALGGAGGEEGESAAQSIGEVLLTLAIDELASELNESIEEVQAQIAEVMETIEDIQGFLEDLENSMSAGFVLHGFKSFCPRQGETFKPYFLSSLDVIAWRWRLPEIIYPITYTPAFNFSGLIASPIADFSQYHVGNFGGSQLFAGIKIPDYNYWGGIYPRGGGVLQADISKARAVAAARAVHVVTRTSQPHIYWPVETSAGWRSKYKGDWYAKTSWLPGPYNPQEESTGLFQLLTTDDNNDGIGVLNQHGIQASSKGSSDTGCLQFGKGDDGFNGTMTNTGIQATSFSNTIDSQDNRMLFNMWRRYECCEDPEPSNGKSKYIKSIPIWLQITG